MNMKVTNQKVISQCKEMLDKWSAGQAYSPTQTLGADAEFVSATAFTMERFTLTTGLRSRKFVRRQLKNGSEYYKNPESIDAFDLWDGVCAENTREDLDVGIDRTQSAIECSDCHGKGKTVCKKCGGRGRYPCKKEHIHFYKDGIHYTNMVYVGGSLNFGKKVIYNGREYVKCKCDPVSNIMECDCDNGYITCKTCSGTGHLIYQWFLVQKYKEISATKCWFPCDKLTEKFYGIDKVSWNMLYDGEVDRGRFKPSIPSDASSEAEVAMREVNVAAEWQARSDEVDAEKEKFAKTDTDASIGTSFERAVFEQFNGIVKYDYKYQGKNYTAWINLGTGAVEECENGLYGEMAEETVRLAKNSEAKGIPQDAIYYYCKADAISLKWGKENGTQKNRVMQYRFIGWLFGGSALAVSLLMWTPLLLTSGFGGVGTLFVVLGLVAITACMISLNEFIQFLGLALVAGIGYSIKSWVGGDIVDDLVTREGLILSLMIYALGLVTITTDHAQRLPFGKKGLVIGGAVAGVAFTPIGLIAGYFSQSFETVGAVLIPLLILVAFSLLRLPYRLKAGKMQKFIENNQGRGERLRKEIEGRKPGKKGLVALLVFLAVTVIVSVAALLLGGVLDSLCGSMHYSIITTLQGINIL